MKYKYEIKLLRPRSNLDILEVAIMCLNQLPDHIKLKTSLIAKDLAVYVLNEYLRSK